MSKQVSVGVLPLSATEDEFRRMSATHGEVASVSTSVEYQSMDRYRDSRGSDLAALVKFEPEVADLKPAPEPPPAAGPVWWAGTLPGVMAGKRPARKLPSPIWGRISRQVNLEAQRGRENYGV